MSPELIEGLKYSYPTDIWAIGAILYEICYLRKAFDGNTYQVMNKIVNP